MRHSLFLPVAHHKTLYPFMARHGRFDSLSLALGLTFCRLPCQWVWLFVACLGGLTLCCLPWVWLFVTVLHPKPLNWCVNHSASLWWLWVGMNLNLVTSMAFPLSTAYTDNDLDSHWGIFIMVQGHNDHLGVKSVSIVRFCSSASMECFLPLPMVDIYRYLCSCPLVCSCPRLGWLQYFNCPLSSLGRLPRGLGNSS